MFSLFPNLLDLYPFAALLLRLAAGYLFVLHAWRLYRQVNGEWSGTKTRKVVHYTLASVHAIVGILFMTGTFVQGAALVGAVITFLGLEATLTRESTTSDREVLLLLCVISLSLLVLGAGPFGFDIPL
jgi:uncharacterized membrane protein YphA (DoxX/SURF4 family)